MRLMKSGPARAGFSRFSLESLHPRAMIALRTYGGSQMRRRSRVPGCIFINNGRYWWRVRLPGEATKRARPLIPAGACCAGSNWRSPGTPPPPLPTRRRLPPRSRGARTRWRDAPARAAAMGGSSGPAPLHLTRGPRHEPRSFQHGTLPRTAAFEPFAGDRASIEGPRLLAPSSTNAAQAHSPAAPPAQGFPDHRPRPNPPPPAPPDITPARTQSPKPPLAVQSNGVFTSALRRKNS
jgi:hypothetical protein